MVRKSILILLTSVFLLSCDDGTGTSNPTSSSKNDPQGYNDCLDSCTDIHDACSKTCKAKYNDAGELDACFTICRRDWSECDGDCKDVYMPDSTSSGNSTSTSGFDTGEDKDPDTNCSSDCSDERRTCDGKCGRVKIADGLYIDDQECKTACWDDWSDCMEDC